MQSRNDQNQNRGNDERGSRQELQAAAGQDKNTQEYGNYGMRDDHRHYDGSQQGSGYGGGSGRQNEQGSSQGYRGGSFETSQGGQGRGQYGDHSSQQSRQGANMNLGMDGHRNASNQGQNHSSGYGGYGGSG